MTSKHIARAEQLKDRRAYRQTLIERRESIERKIEAVEREISRLTSSAVVEKVA